MLTSWQRTGSPKHEFPLLSWFLHHSFPSLLNCLMMSNLNMGFCL